MLTEPSHLQTTFQLRPKRRNEAAEQFIGQNFALLVLWVVVVLKVIWWYSKLSVHRVITGGKLDGRLLQFAIENQLGGTDERRSNSGQPQCNTHFH